MMIVLNSFLAPLLLSSFVSGLQNGNIEGDGFIRFALTANENVIRPSSLHKRQTGLAAKNYLNGTSYSVKLAIGTPPQPVELSIDTGSGITWVDPDCIAGNEDYEKKFCQSLDRYSTENSSTAHRLDSGMRIQYADNSVVTLGFWEDKFTVGSAEITGQRFGVASYTHNQQQGILGIGPIPDDAQLKNFSTVLEGLAQQKRINTTAYTLDLRSQDQSALIFGGIDTKKYQCHLEKINIVPNFDSMPRIIIYLTGVGISYANSSTTKYPIDKLTTRRGAKGLPVNLDSGGTVSILPAKLVHAIGTDYPGAVWDSYSRLYNASCDAPAGTIDFTFGRKRIAVPFKDFLWVRPKTTQCVLGMITGKESVMFLGDSFLRAAYVVVDQPNEAVWIDQADDCGSDLLAIGAGRNGMPQVKGCNCDM